MIRIHSLYKSIKQTFLTKFYHTDKQKASWKLLGVSLLFLHIIFLPEVIALPLCVNYRNPFHLYRQNLAFILLLSALPLLSGKIGGKCVFFFYGLWGFFNCIILYSLIHFHLLLDYTTLQILSVTNSSEISEFCNSFLHWYDFLPFGIVIALVVLCLRHTKKLSRFSIKLGFVLMLPFLLSFFPSVCRGKFSWFGKRNALCRFILNSVAQYSKEMKQLHKRALSPRIPSNIHMIEDCCSAEPILGVVVVGESARRSNFQCYGYGRPTTPNLLMFSKQCLFFDDVISPATSTLRCCVYEFTDAKVGNGLQMQFSICDFLKAGGYQVGLYSNQRRSGRHESLGLLFHRANEKKYLDEEGNVDGYDTPLVSLLKNSSLITEANPAVIFLHTMGSHHHAKKRYPPLKKYFATNYQDECNSNMDPLCSEYVNHYDNSIRLTDELLGDIMTYLNSLHRPAFLLYLSDHAEILFHKDKNMSTNFRDNKNPNSYEIPFVIFLNNKYMETYSGFSRDMAKNIHQPMQADAAIYAIASLARLTCDDFPYTSDVTSKQYAPATRYLAEKEKIIYSKNDNGERKQLP